MITAPTDVSVQHPLVVLGVPVFNEARFLRATLESIRAQSHVDFAVFISDNASTDESESICREFAASDQRFEYHRHPSNLGAVENFEFLRRASESPFFAWVGAHDILQPDYLARHLASLRLRADVAVSFTRLEWIDEGGAVVRRKRNRGIRPPCVNPTFRFLWALVIGIDIDPIHGVWRRSIMTPKRLCPCFATDHLFLSNALYSGQFQELNARLYQLRRIRPTTGRSSYIERITGQVGSREDRTAAADAFLRDFDSTVQEGSWVRALRPLVHWFLRDRLCGSRPGRVGNALRSLVMLSQSVESWFSPRGVQ